MAHPNTHRGQANSLHKRGLITDKQHAKMMSRIDAMVVPDANAPGGPADPHMAAAVAPAPAAQVPITASVPGDPNAEGDPTKAQQPPVL